MQLPKKLAIVHQPHQRKNKRRNSKCSSGCCSSSPARLLYEPPGLQAVQWSDLMLPTPGEICLTVPAEEADSWKRNEVSKDSQGIWRAVFRLIQSKADWPLIPIPFFQAFKRALGRIKHLDVSTFSAAALLQCIERSPKSDFCGFAATSNRASTFTPKFSSSAPLQRAATTGEGGWKRCSQPPGLSPLVLLRHKPWEQTCYFAVVVVRSAAFPALDPRHEKTAYRPCPRGEPGCPRVTGHSPRAFTQQRDFI
ncbi:uncharacterized protein LOC141946744 [Strix uralensis]|uniref:uncharacterized protein LOC141946744 n=1 Tax=Strix uralensis TaxID=36305 RepID=UPI003DA79DE3